MFGFSINIYIALAIIFGVMIAMVLAAVIIYRAKFAKQRSEALKSIPKGGDTSDYARLLQDKYKAERDSGEFKRQGFN